MKTKVVKNVQKVGFLGLLFCIINKLIFVADYLRPSFRRRLIEENTFDKKLGIDTHGKIDLHDLDVPEEHSKHCRDYEPTNVWLFKKAFGCLDIDHEDYIFIDYGSGKGRILLLASRFPFKKIIGIEISKKLHEIAVKNVANHNKELQKCYDINSYCFNAESFEIPNENAVFYFFNPFDDYIMNLVLHKIEASFKKYHKKLILIYINPVHHKLFDQLDILQVVKKDKRYRVYVGKKP